MTDAERLAAIGQRGRICTSCAGLIVQWRPVYLIGDASGEIRGPYHASCAERVALARKKRTVSMMQQGELFGSLRPRAEKGDEPG